MLFVEKVSMLGAFVVQLSQASIGIWNRELLIVGKDHSKNDENVFNMNHRCKDD